MLLIAIIVFCAAVWGFFQLSSSHRKIAFSVLGALCIVWLVTLSAGPVFGHYLDDPIGSGLILMSLTGALVAWFVYTVAVAIIRKRAPSEQAFIEARNRIRKVFFIYVGGYVGVSVVVRFAIFLYFIRESHAWEAAGMVSFLVPKWPFYLAAIFGYHLYARRKAAAAHSRKPRA
jgi:hypothetical protein